MKIGAKPVVVISAINITGIAILTGVSLFQSQREISRLADEEARNIAAQSSEQIENWLNEYMDTARTLAMIMEAYKETPVEERRNRFNDLMKQVLIRTPGLANVYSHWAPLSLDGMDAQYVNTPESDETGRYTSSRIEVAETHEVILTKVDIDWNTVVQLNLTDDYMLEPFVYPVAGKNYLTASFGVPIKESGRVIGYVGGSVDLSTIQAIADELKPLGDGRAVVFSSGGMVTAHSDPNRLGKNIRETEQDTFDPFLDTMVNAVAAGTSASFSYRSANSDTVIQYYAVPFAIGRFPGPWTLVVGVSRNTIMAPVYRMLGISLIIGFLSVVFMMGGAFLMARSISRPINTLARMFKDISEGEGDLTKTITITERNEIGDLAHYFNFTIDKIKSLVVSIRKKADVLSDTGTDLAADMTETAASIEEITANIQSLASRSEKQAANIKNTDAVMVEMMNNIESLNRQIEKQTGHVSQSSSAVEEMLANIQSVTQTLIGNEKNVTGLAEASGIGRSGLQGVAGDIKEIARESEG
ncbi:MAG: methyl-accepting chemotaxis protein, partial [Treponema sp.]|nr:methyl-accepting chemotaxis protein [Treponema sp.]